MGLLALARIAVHVIPLRPVNPLAGTAVPNQPVSFVHMALARIAALVIPILGVPLNVLPVETVVSEKNVTKSVNSLAAAFKVARVAREAITVVASEVITEEDLVVITEEDSVERVAREERVARVDTTTVDNTKYVNSFVNL